MTSRIIPADKAEEKKWPRLMIDKDGWVYLMKSEHKGIIVFLPEEDYDADTIGDYSETWNASMTDFHGTVELSND